MTEEIQPSYLLFSDKQILHPKVEKRKTDKKTQKNISVPVNIKEFSGNSWVREYLHAHSIFDEEETEEEIVPPHVIVDRRVARKAAFSLCSGNGRTLKGRDLSEVRNSILKMTGFLES